MIVYRFAHSKYAHELSGNGARMFGGRWNPAGTPVLYASQSISLALLEVLVNAHTIEQLQSIQLMEIDIPGLSEPGSVKLQQLKKDWYNDIDYTQWLGKEILQSKKSLLYECPSAVIHKEHNYLIDTLHPDFKKVKLRNAADFHFDERLFKQRIN